MAGTDGGEEIIKQGFMVKRSQNKKRFSPINYKQRWFVLTRRHLIYYDSEGEVSLYFSFWGCWESGNIFLHRCCVLLFRSLKRKGIDPIGCRFRLVVRECITFHGALYTLGSERYQHDH